MFPFGKRQVWHLVKRYGATIGKDVHSHTFRHAFAINCVRNGWDIRRLQQVLGHYSLTTTAVYLQSTDGDSKAAYENTPF
jgi:integrase/recombinase XerD